jgi:hypothetical protein
MPARRFLASQARAGDGLGYLSQPERELPVVADPPEVAERIGEARSMCDEPEAPSRAWVDAEAELAVERNRLRLLHRAEQAQRARQFVSMENRMRDADRRAKLQHVDLTSEFFVLRKMLGRGKERAALVRLEGLEARLDGVAGLEAA